MKIIDDSRHASGWLTAEIQGRYVQAKVYDEPSEYGVGGYGRVSKLTIGRGPTRDPRLPFFEQMAFNYDRGLDFHDAKALTQARLDAIVAALEALPPAM